MGGSEIPSKIVVQDFEIRILPLKSRKIWQMSESQRFLHGEGLT